jgi:hypothetical protein
MAQHDPHHGPHQIGSGSLREILVIRCVVGPLRPALDRAAHAPGPTQGTEAPVSAGCQPEGELQEERARRVEHLVGRLRCCSGRGVRAEQRDHGVGKSRRKPAIFVIPVSQQCQSILAQHRTGQGDAVIPGSTVSARPQLDPVRGDPLVPCGPLRPRPISTAT